MALTDEAKQWLRKKFPRLAKGKEEKFAAMTGGQQEQYKKQKEEQEKKYLQQEQMTFNRWKEFSILQKKEENSPEINLRINIEYKKIQDVHARLYVAKELNIKKLKDGHDHKAFSEAIKALLEIEKILTEENAKIIQSGKTEEKIKIISALDSFIKGISANLNKIKDIFPDYYKKTKEIFSEKKIALDESNYYQETATDTENFVNLIQIWNIYTANVTAYTRESKSDELRNESIRAYETLRKEVNKTIDPKTLLNLKTKIENASKEITNRVVFFATGVPNEEDEAAKIERIARIATLTEYSAKVQKRLSKETDVTNKSLLSAKLTSLQKELEKGRKVNDSKIIAITYYLDALCDSPIAEELLRGTSAMKDTGVVIFEFSKKNTEKAEIKQIHAQYSAYQEKERRVLELLPLVSDSEQQPFAAKLTAISTTLTYKIENKEETQTDYDDLFTKYTKQLETVEKEIVENITSKTTGTGKISVDAFTKELGELENLRNTVFEKISKYGLKMTNPDYQTSAILELYSTAVKEINILPKIAKEQLQKIISLFDLLNSKVQDEVKRTKEVMAKLNEWGAIQSQLEKPCMEILVPIKRPDGVDRETLNQQRELLTKEENEFMSAISDGIALGFQLPRGFEAIDEKLKRAKNALQERNKFEKSFVTEYREWTETLKELEKISSADLDKIKNKIADSEVALMENGLEFALGILKEGKDILKEKKKDISNDKDKWAKAVKIIAALKDYKKVVTLDKYEQKENLAKIKLLNGVEESDICQEINDEYLKISKRNQKIVKSQKEFKEIDIRDIDPAFLLPVGEAISKYEAEVAKFGNDRVLSDAEMNSQFFKLKEIISYAKWRTEIESSLRILDRKDLNAAQKEELDAIRTEINNLFIGGTEDKTKQGTLTGKINDLLKSLNSLAKVPLKNDEDYKNILTKVKISPDLAKVLQKDEQTIKNDLIKYGEKLKEKGNAPYWLIVIEGLINALESYDKLDAAKKLLCHEMLGRGKIETTDLARNLSNAAVTASSQSITSLPPVLAPPLPSLPTEEEKKKELKAKNGDLEKAEYLRTTLRIRDENVPETVEEAEKSKKSKEIKELENLWKTILDFDSAVASIGHTAIAQKAIEIYKTQPKGKSQYEEGKKRAEEIKKFCEQVKQFAVPYFSETLFLESIPGELTLNKPDLKVLTKDAQAAFSQYKIQREKCKKYHPEITTDKDLKFIYNLADNPADNITDDLADNIVNNIVDNIKAVSKRAELLKRAVEKEEEKIKQLKNSCKKEYEDLKKKLSNKEIKSVLPTILLDNLTHDLTAIEPMLTSDILDVLATAETLLQKLQNDVDASSSQSQQGQSKSQLAKLPEIKNRLEAAEKVLEEEVVKIRCPKKRKQLEVKFSDEVRIIYGTGLTSDERMNKCLALVAEIQKLHNEAVHEGILHENFETLKNVLEAQIKNTAGIKGTDYAKSLTAQIASLKARLTQEGEAAWALERLKTLQNDLNMAISDPAYRFEIEENIALEAKDKEQMRIRFDDKLKAFQTNEYEIAEEIYKAAKEKDETLHEDMKKAKSEAEKFRGNWATENWDGKNVDLAFEKLETARTFARQIIATPAGSAIGGRKKLKANFTLFNQAVMQFINFLEKDFIQAAHADIKNADDVSVPDKKKVETAISSQIDKIVNRFRTAPLREAIALLSDAKNERDVCLNAREAAYREILYYQNLFKSPLLVQLDTAPVYRAAIQSQKATFLDSLDKMEANLLRAVE